MVDVFHDQRQDGGQLLEDGGKRSFLSSPSPMIFRNRREGKLVAEFLRKGTVEAAGSR